MLKLFAILKQISSHLLILISEKNTKEDCTEYNM